MKENINPNKKIKVNINVKININIIHRILYYMIIHDVLLYSIITTALPFLVGDLVTKDPLQGIRTATHLQNRMPQALSVLLFRV